MSDERFISVIGLGRIGLPLAMSFFDHGLRVLGIDHDPGVLDAVRARPMPFAEAGTQELALSARRGGRCGTAVAANA